MSAIGAPRRLALEIRFDRQPIEGRLYDGDVNGRIHQPFSGWLGLIAAIENAAVRFGDAKEEAENEA